ncbi:MAG: DNA-directed RNA polymerase subunit H [Candidatus Woesearchaeota archaeon]
MKEEFEVSKHSLVPKHVLLSKDEAMEVLKKYNLILSQLPKITKKDSAVVGLGAGVGDIIKIIRKSVTAGETVYYRVVVND